MLIPLKGYRGKLCFLMTCIKAFSKISPIYTARLDGFTNHIILH